MTNRLPAAASTLQHDDLWDASYPTQLRAVAEFHFSPLAIIDAASDWLSASESARIVDLGAGTGKFCVRSAMRHAEVRFYGIEVRRALVLEAHRWIEAYHLSNARVRVGDASEAALAGYTGAYVFNPFYELVDQSSQIDASLDGDAAIYRAKCLALRQNLSRTPTGFRLVTYFCHGLEVPESFTCEHHSEDDKLQFWVHR